MTNEGKDSQVETELLLCILHNNDEVASTIIQGMTDKQIDDLRRAFRKGKWLVEDEQATRYANSRENAARDGLDAAGDSDEE